MCLGFGPDFPNKNKTIKKRKSVQSIPSWCGTPFFIKLPGHASLINLIISPSCVSSNYFQTVEATEVNVILSLSAAFWKISSRCCFTEGSVGSQSVYIYIYHYQFISHYYEVNFYPEFFSEVKYAKKTSTFQHVASLKLTATALWKINGWFRLISFWCVRPKIFRVKLLTDVTIRLKMCFFERNLECISKYVFPIRHIKRS